MRLSQLPFYSKIYASGGEIFSVGGTVRDSFLGLKSKDLDILVTGIPMDQLETILSKFGRVDMVGKSFGVIKFKSPQTGEIDIAIPRTEKKNDKGGYQGFDVWADHTLPIEKDLERRDFTINAIAKDAKGKIVDPYDGRGDIERKLIRMVNPQAFSDDPLRMLRAVQFASRFGFDIEIGTLRKIQDYAEMIKEISPERILIEFDKIVKKGNPKIGAMHLLETGLYYHIFKFDKLFIETDLSNYDNVRTMGEFIFELTRSITKSPAEFYRDHLKGDVDTYKEIRAYEVGFGKTDRSTVFHMYKIFPASVKTKIFGQAFIDTVSDMIDKEIPFTVGELMINGNDLLELGFVSKEIANTFLEVLNRIYYYSLKNDRQEILEYIKNNLIVKHDA